MLMMFSRPVICRTISMEYAGDIIISEGSLMPQGQNTK